MERGQVQCTWMHKWIVGSYTAGLAIADGVLVLRTWVIWGATALGALVLFPVFVILVAAIMVLVSFFSSSYQFSYPPSNLLQGCFAVAVDDLIAAVWALWLAIELLVLLATLLRGIRHRFGKDTRGILNTLYWDALKFALLMTALSITSVVSTFTLPPSYKTATASLQRVMHSILASHVLLRLRRKVSEMPPVQASTTQTGFWVDSIAGYQIVSKDKSEVEA